jgi:hypothetical protein
MGEQQKHRRGQVDTMTGVIVTHSRHFEGWAAEERQFVIQEPPLALELFRYAIRDRESSESRKKRIAGLKYLIRVSQDGNEFLKKLMFFLIEKSELLTKAVYITFHPSEEFDGKDIHRQACAESSFHSSNRPTHLNELMALLGTDFRFSVHYGHYQDGRFDTVGMFAGFPGRHEFDPKNMPTRYTFWLGPQYYGHGPIPPEEIKASRAEVEAVDITRDGLYDHTS